MSILDDYMKYQITKLLCSQIDVNYSPVRKQIREAFAYPCVRKTTITVEPRHYPVRAYRRR